MPPAEDSAERKPPAAAIVPPEKKPRRILLAIAALCLVVGGVAVGLFVKSGADDQGTPPAASNASSNKAPVAASSDAVQQPAPSLPAGKPAPAPIHTNSLGMTFVLIPAGSFTMGSQNDVPNTSSDEKPAHKVTIGKPFYLGQHEVTQAQWEAVMENNPSRVKGQNNPVTNVSWDGVQKFISRLNEKEGHDRYRLPTEAEWEYAARAGTATAYSFGDDAGSLGRYAWYEDNSGGKTQPVGQKQPNAWGLYDMHGNVWEWVQDWVGEWYYSNSPDADPKGPPSGEMRVFRGGSWFGSAGFSRAAFRYYESPDHSGVNLGFRLVLSLEE
jgi:formylglycine-generating enzyme required for sulfatase activity